MKFSYNLLQEYFKQKLPKPEKLADVLTMHSFEVGNTVKLGKDYILDIDVLPNRMPDCGGHEGLAREISVITSFRFADGHEKGEKLKIQSAIETSRLKLKKYLEVKIEDKDLCLRYTATVMRNVKVEPAPKKIKEYLETLGINSINNMVDAANYIMLKTGQPLHIFDLDKIESISSFKKQIIVRRAKNGESITALDNKKYDLDESVLVIADSKEPLAVAGIKGGKKAEVDFNTKNIILEAANFDLTNIRKTSQKLNLRTDASIRFSYNLDPNLCDKASLELVNLIKSFCGGEMLQFVDVYPKKAVSVPIKVDFDKTRKILGVGIKDKDIKNIFQKLGFIVKSSGKIYAVYPLTVRRDINIEEDLIEEVGRVYGYERIKPSLPLSELVPTEENRERGVLKAVRIFFANQGFSEFYNYSFIGENDKEIAFKAGVKEMNELQNPLSPDMKFLRPALIFNILKNISFNLKNYDIVKMFELGKIFSFLKNGAANSLSDFENNNLAAVIACKNADGKELFFKLKGVISSIFELSGVQDVKFDNSGVNNGNEILLSYFCHPYRYAKIKIKENSIGVLGEVKSDILANYDIKRGVAVFFEINFDAFLKFVKEEKEFKSFSRFPKLDRDLSLFAPYDAEIEKVKNVIENQGGKLLTSCEIFDIYEPALSVSRPALSADKSALYASQQGEPAGGNGKFEGRKSIAFRLTFQSEEKTLLDKEVDAIMEKIIKALEENLEWKVRK